MATDHDQAPRPRGDTLYVTGPDEQDDKPSGGLLRSLFGWLRRVSPRSGPSGDGPTQPGGGIPVRVGHYAIQRKLGEGGMGVVYAARDERLRRDVAVKMIGKLAVTETTRKRFWREARAAASVNHPNICQVYEIGEDGDQLFIAMEFLEGEDLADRLLRGPVGVRETLQIGGEILAALSALHDRGIVHRDLKPSNVFLTNHGVKLLDFGVARPDLDQSVAPATGLTPTGMPIGTPRYMAPEVATGEGVDARSDLFAVGAIVFEMLAGRPAFQGRTIIEVLHATLHEQPPALSGSPTVAAIDRVIRRALAKRPIERIASAQAMREELVAIRGEQTDDTPVVARTLTRIVVLPFRVLRPDAESDFLAFSLPDAIANSLSSIGSLVVRSSAVAARFAGQTPDLKAIAADADVDRVVMGTVLRSGQEVRAAAQLVEAPAGTLLTSLTVQSSMDDLFRLQDDITRQVVDALSLPLAGMATSAGPDTPHDPRAYELYLRANELARTYDGLIGARDLYQRCVELDPSFAPAWAHLGRCHRVIVKYVEGSPDGEQKAEDALKHALQLNPRLSLAHRFYAGLEADVGHAREGMVRLLGEANRHGNDPELFAGLVHTCRYCGLFDEAIAAHAEARRLDPNVPTSVGQTVLMTGDFKKVLGIETPAIDPGADEGMRVIAFGLLGQKDEAREVLAGMSRPRNIPAFRLWTDNLRAWLDNQPGNMLLMTELGPLRIQDDPEAIFQQGWLLCDVGDYEPGLEHVQRAVAKGYYPVRTLSDCRQFDGLRSDARFRSVVADATAGRDQALEAFRGAGGVDLL